MLLIAPLYVSMSDSGKKYLIGIHKIELGVRT